MNKIELKATRLLWKYNNILLEIIAQRKFYPTESHFWSAWCKYAKIVSKLQGTLLSRY